MKVAHSLEAQIVCVSLFSSDKLTAVQLLNRFFKAVHFQGHSYQVLNYLPGKLCPFSFPLPRSIDADNAPTPFPKPGLVIFKIISNFTAKDILILNLYFFEFYWRWSFFHEFLAFGIYFVYLQLMDILFLYLFFFNILRLLAHYLMLKIHTNYRQLNQMM